MLKLFNFKLHSLVFIILALFNPKRIREFQTLWTLQMPVALYVHLHVASVMMSSLWIGWVNFIKKNKQASENKKKKWQGIS